MSPLCMSLNLIERHCKNRGNPRSHNALRALREDAGQRGCPVTSLTVCLGHLERHQG